MRSLPFHLVLVSLAACVAQHDASSAAAASGTPATGVTQAPRPATDAPQGGAARFAPPAPNPDDADWIRLKSGEWLRGRIRSLRDGTLEFESDELDDQTFDWDDVPELRSPSAQTLRLDTGAEYSGTVLIRDGRVTVGGPAPQELTRARLLAIVPQSERERDRWSGTISLGLTDRRGNTDQTDFSSYLFMRRETSATRWDTTYNGAFSRVNTSDGDSRQTANNHRLRARFDWFLTRRLYLTVLGADMFRDRFQNIELRATPYAALGYDVVDETNVSWSLSAGPAYQFTRFDSVQPDEDEDQDTFAAVFQNRFDWDISNNVEFGIDYDITIPLPDTNRYNHHFAAILSVDLFQDLDLDISWIWDRVNDPLPNGDGSVPDKDDFRMSVSIGYDF